MSEHTPLPWFQGKNHPCRVITHDSNVAYCCLPVDEGSESDIERANAEFIARACNCHDELRAACVEALFWLDCTSPGEEACAMKLAAIIAKAESKVASCP